MATVVAVQEEKVAAAQPRKVRVETQIDYLVATRMAD